MALRSTRGARKSEVADPSLYEEEDEDDSPIQHPSNTSRTSVPSKKAVVKAAVPPRRSGRLSTESTSTMESPIAKPTPKQSKSRVKTTTSSTATPSKNGKKGKQVAGSLVPQSRTREERDKEDGDDEGGNVDYQEDGEPALSAVADGQRDKPKKARVADSTATTGRKFMVSINSSNFKGLVAASYHALANIAPSTATSRRSTCESRESSTKV